MDDYNKYGIKVGDTFTVLSKWEITKIDELGCTRKKIDGSKENTVKWDSVNDLIKDEIWEFDRKLTIQKKENMLTELPENWYVIVTKENEETLLKWLPNSSKYNTPYIIGLYSWKHELSKKVKGQTHLANLAKDTKSYTFGKEISFEDFKRLVLKEEKMEILKEKQQLSIKGIICEVYKRGDSWYYLTSRDPFIDQSSLWAALGISKDDKENFTRKVLGYYASGGFPECKSLEDLTKLVQAIKNYKMNKKIIGYKAPMDLFGSFINTGDTYISYATGFYQPIKKKGDTSIMMPSEIVETWEPVYEVQKLIKVGEHQVQYLSNALVKIGCTEYTKSQLKGAEMLLETKNIKCIMCDDDTKIDIGIIRQLIQGLES